MAYVYVKDKDGFVVKKKKADILPDEIIITKSEYEELSGDKYYQERFAHGGKRDGAGRKPKTGVVLQFQIRVSEKEKEFINWARNHNLNYDELMQS